MMQKNNSKTGLRLIQLYIFIIFTYGFWVNFTHITLILDFALILILIYTFIRNRAKYTFNSDAGSIVRLCEVFCFGVVIIAIVMCFTPRMSILAARGYIAYIILAICIDNIELNEKDFVAVLNTIELFGTCSAIFGIIQSIFNESLPSELLHVASAGNYGYVYGLGSIVFRNNGLFENSIVYGGMLAILAVFIMGRIIFEKHSPIHYICFALVIVSLVLTYSRMALVGTCIVIMIEELFNQNKTVGHRIIAVLAFVLAIMIIIRLFFSDSVFYQNLMGLSTSSIASNEQHIHDFQSARNLLSNHWILGVGMGTQGYESTGSTIKVITDGGWYTYALELGLPLTFLYIFILILIIKKSISYLKKDTFAPYQKSASLATAGALILFILNSFVNSGYLARENMAIIWLFIALTFYGDFYEEAYE